MKVFIGSLIRGFEAYREAVASAISDLDYDVIRAEDFPASAETPQQACLDGVRQSDLVVFLLSSAYGQLQTSGLSATHEEYIEARETKPVLVFLHDGVELEPEQKNFIQQVRDWSGGSLTGSFDSPDDLRREVTRAIHRHAMRNAGSPAPDLDVAGERARGVLALSSAGQDREPLLVLGLAFAPAQPLLRPAEMESSDLRRDLTQAALFGAWPLFDSRSGVTPRMDGDYLVLEQDEASLALDTGGTVRIALPAVPAERDSRAGLTAIIEEEIRDELGRALRFAHVVIGRIDPTHRVSEVVLAAALQGIGYMPWRTRDEHARSPNSMTMRGTHEDVVVELAPPSRPRAALEHQAGELAEDFTALLGRRMREP